MRTLSWISRAFAVSAAIVAAIIVVGGSYFVGFVSEVQRGLNDPESASRQASEKIAAIEQMLGYNGYLKSYRSFRLTGDVSAREQMSQRAMEAARTLDILRKLYSETPAATQTISDIGSVVEEFAHVARISPDLGPAALRGSASMDALESMPQFPQLEATYLTLRTALERLRSQTQSHQMGSIAWALSWSQMLIVCTLALLVCGLLAAAGLLQLGITQPLKSLEQSLNAVSDGHVNQRIWGTDRSDEIGTMARAGEKLRKSLNETETLKALAQKGEVHLRLEGEASVLLEKLASGVTSAAEALMTATAEISETHQAQRQQFEESLQKLGDYGPKFDEIAMTVGKAAKDAFSGASTNLHNSMSKLVTAAEERTGRLEQITGQFEQSGRQLSDAVDLVRVKTGNAVDGITTSITAFKKAADSAQAIQGAFFTACDRISSDASSTAENVRGLASQLNGVVDTVDNRLQQKLHGLDKLEAGIEATLGGIERRAKETTDAIAAAGAALEHRTAQNERRTEQSIDEFEEIVSLFREEQTQRQTPMSHEAFSQIVSQLNDVCLRLQDQLDRGSTTTPYIQALTTALSRKIDLSINSLNAQTEKSTTVLATAAAAIELRSGKSERQIEHSIAEIQQIVDLFRSTTPTRAAEPETSGTPGVEEIVGPLTRQIETLRNDVRELAMRMTEERILMTAEMPASTIPHEHGIASGLPQRSLSDIPIHEILTRLQDLAQEMSTASEENQPQPLPSALEAFAQDLKSISHADDPLENLKQRLPKLERHANDIDSGAREVTPSATALRTELSAITSELRRMTAGAHDKASSGGEDLREASQHLGARAETLFAYLSQTSSEDYPSLQHAPIPVANRTIEQTADDLDTLAQIIARLEQRTSRLSDAAVAANLHTQTNSASPMEQSPASSGNSAQSDHAITVVYASIERLNSIAAALARAGDANSQRKAAM
ncbi:MAG: HAMP domain-containing protein [Micropepsaceae bacterium]